MEVEAERFKVHGAWHLFVNKTWIKLYWTKFFKLTLLYLWVSCYPSLPYIYILILLFHVAVSLRCEEEGIILSYNILFYPNPTRLESTLSCHLRMCVLKSENSFQDMYESETKRKEKLNDLLFKEREKSAESKALLK